MKSLKQKVYDTCISIKRKNGVPGKINVVEKYMSNGNFKMSTNMLNGDTNMAYSPKYAEVKGEDKLIETFKSGQEHEDGHHIDCPQTVDKDTDLFFEPMYEILSKNGFKKADVNYATNALQDSILHDKGKYQRKLDWNGIINFFEDQGENSNNQKLTGFYEAHVKMNMDLWGRKDQRKLLSKFYTNEAKVKESLDGIYGELNDGKFKTIKEGYVKTKGKERGFYQHQAFNKVAIQKYFLNEKNWQEISTVYAKHMQKLMTPGYAMPTLDHSGAGTKGRESEDSGNEGTPFQKERESREFKKGRIMDANRKGKKAPVWMEKMEVLDLVYEGLANQIQIKAESYTNPKSFPITWYGEREFDEERDNFKNISFGFNDKGESEIRKKQYSIDIPIEVKTSPKSFPKIKFGLIDVSSSMLSGISGDSGSDKIIPWGDNSRYHWALMTQFGIYEYFKKNHLLTQNSISVATFAEDTVVVDGYQKVKEHLLTPNFVSDTKIDIGQIKKFFEGYDNLIYTCSDGQINNWSDIENEFVEEAKKHAYVHFQFGGETSMTRSLKKNGLEVILAEDGKGVVQDVINLTDKIIRGS